MAVPAAICALTNRVGLILITAIISVALVYWCFLATAEMPFCYRRAAYRLPSNNNGSIVFAADVDVLWIFGHCFFGIGSRFFSRGFRLINGRPEKITTPVGIRHLL